MAGRAEGTGSSDGGDDGTGTGDAEQFLYGLMALAEEQQAAVGAALAGLAAEREALAVERAALGKQAEAVRGETVRLRQAAAELGPGLARAAGAAVERSLVGAGGTAVAAVEAAAQPVLARLDGMAAQAGAAEAALRRVVGWASWRLLGRGAAVAAAVAGLLWLAHLSVWWWAERDVALSQAQRSLLLADIAGLQEKRDELEASQAALEKAGALAKLNRCNPGNRPCIRVNEAAGPFTSGADTYRVIQGY